ncbi:hypothetical protein GCM10009535_60420 [Streptomyces thermocarboxydovorans]|uniref:Uncharacterized protein n=1 Tax=Streptomyces thermocarboxydovorans TaxID=59298 RepID=A0ABP3T101_9ACTN
MEPGGHEVVAAARQQHRIRADPGRADAGADGTVARPVQAVVLAVGKEPVKTCRIMCVSM